MITLYIDYYIEYQIDMIIYRYTVVFLDACTYQSRAQILDGGYLVSCNVPA